VRSRDPLWSDVSGKRDNAPLDKLAVFVPTRNRPLKLEKCLRALQSAQEGIPFLVYVCDSSDKDEVREQVHEVSRSFDFVRFRQHRRVGFGAARNFAVRAAEAEWLINLDDDVYVEPDAIAVLYEACRQGPGLSAIAGSVAWGDEWSAPVVTRWIGYGRACRPGEKPSFLIGALVAFPRSLGLGAPWNERIRSSDDRFIGALWRAKGVALRYEPRARARHDEEHTTGLQDVQHQDAHIYTNLFDSLLAEPSLPRAAAYEVIGFLAGPKKHGRDPRTVRDTWAPGLTVTGPSPGTGVTSRSSLALPARRWKTGS
jgi:glycosyltransferase involved in cell wall biosynthesis